MFSSSCKFLYCYVIFPTSSVLPMQVSSVSGELVLNQESLPWWSFYDVNASDVVGCNELTGPMAIVVSEETPRECI